MIGKDKLPYAMGMNMKEIYLAGGCFWGTEQYFSMFDGIIKTEVGYANGKTQHPTYEEVCYKNTGHAETVGIWYDPQIITLPFLLEHYYDVINPTSINRQGGDIGTQYRTGIYFVTKEDEPVIRESLRQLQLSYEKPVAIEVMPLENYYRAEDYHQKYLDKNPNGYCHIGRDKFDKAKNAKDIIRKYVPKSDSQLKEELTEIQYRVTQKNATEPPYQNEYFDNFKPGIYVDITTGEPLFVSTDKFESGCGWPSFTKPIQKDFIIEQHDNTHGMIRTEVRSKIGDSHLGHVFPDGPQENGGLRYCINSASLLFVSKEAMEKEGYRHLLSLL